MKQFICIGNLNFDIIHVIDRMPEEHEKYRARNTICQFGGASSNTAYWLSRESSDVILIGCVGHDYIGSIYIEHIKSLNINADYIQITKDASTSLLTVLTNSSSKRMISSGEANNFLDTDRIPYDLFNENTHVHIAYSDKSKVKKILTMAKKRNATTSIELKDGYDLEIISMSDISFINRDDFRRWYSSENYFNYWSKKMPSSSALAITLGNDGASYVKGNLHVIKPIENKVDVVDKTGGGDAFDAGFLMYWSNGYDADLCLKQGLSLAAEALTFIGSRPINL